MAEVTTHLPWAKSDYRSDPLSGGSFWRLTLAANNSMKDVVIKVGDDNTVSNADVAAALRALADALD